MVYRETSTSNLAELLRIRVAVKETVDGPRAEVTE